MTSVLVKNAQYIITLDRKRRIIRKGGLAIEDDRITDIGKSDEVSKRSTSDLVIDAKGKVVLPGLVNSHVHSIYHFGRSAGDECDMHTMLNKRMYPLISAVRPNDAYWSSLLCQIEMVKTGTTTFIDHGSDFPDETVKAASKTGMRGVVSRVAYDSGGEAARKTANELKKSEAVVRSLDGANDGRIKAWFSLRRVAACSDELIQKASEMAKVRNVGLQSHASSTLEGVKAGKKRWGYTDVERLSKLDVLTPHLFLIHMGWATKTDIKMLVANDVKVAHCPTASVHLGMGSTSKGLFPEMLKMGIAVGLGTDCSAASNHMDMVRTMATMSCLKEVRLDASVMTAETVLEMATINGARAALMEKDIGSLEVGKKADLVIFDATSGEWVPNINPISNLVYSASGSSADTVIIDGKLVMEGRQLQGIDEKNSVEKANKVAMDLIQKAEIEYTMSPTWPIH